MAERRQRGTQINFRISDELRERFETRCNSLGITMTQFLENSIRQALGEPLTIPQSALGSSTMPSNAQELEAFVRGILLAELGNRSS